MNEKQKKLLIAVAAVIFGMMLFPPFRYTIPQLGGVAWSAYEWILGPHQQATINIGQLLTQWVGVLIIGGIAYFILQGR